MIFWVWAKGLEDTFDGKTRMNLRHLIEQSRGHPDADDDGDQDKNTHYFLRDSKTTAVEKFDDGFGANDLGGDRKELQRISSCAIFHKVTSGKGVPHTFTGKFHGAKRGLLS
jgi:KUP system potassium uptake protein